MEKNDKLLLIGGGGHCKIVLDSLLQANRFAKVGIIDLPDNVGQQIMGVNIIGSDQDLEMLYQEGYHYAFVTLGSIGDPSRRIQLFSILTKIGFQLPNIIDPTATISRFTEIEYGIYIGKNVAVNADAVIGKGVIINTSSIIEHDCRIEEFVHVSPGSILCGGVTIGKNTHIGAGSMIKQQIVVGSNCVIGMGSVVLQNIKDAVMAYGNPCKEVKPL